MTHDAGEIEKLLERVENAGKMLSGGNTVGTSTIHVNAGGAGIWACLTACLISLAMCLIMAVMYVDTNRKFDRVQDYLNSIYNQAPQLKPKD